MLKEHLKAYRAERKAFITSLEYYFDIDFYKLDADERKCWLACYLENKKEFFRNMEEHLKEEFKEFKYLSKMKNGTKKYEQLR